MDEASVEHAGTTTDPAPSDPARGARLPLLIGGAVLLIATGLGVGLLLAGGNAPTPNVAQPTAPPERLAATVSDAPPAPTGAVEPGPATDAAGAASGWLTAEANRSFDVAWTHLAPDEQDAFGSAQGYVAAHADLLGQVTGFELLGTETTAGEGVVTARVGFVPSLDVVTGLVPAVATLSIPVVEVEGGWAIRLSGTTFEPVLPSDERAVEDASAWVSGVVAGDNPARAATGPLLGRGLLEDELRAAEGDVVAGAVGALDDPVVLQPFVSAFGEGVTQWARVVEITSPVALRVVVAPFGDGWTVIGLLRPT